MTNETGGSMAGEGRRRKFSATLLAALFVVCLALAAVFWPRPGADADASRFVVLDPLVALRGEACYESLVESLSATGGGPLQLEVCTSLAELRAQPQAGIALLLVPDAVAIGLPAATFVSLAVGRRHTPQNLRSRSVLVHRLATEAVAEPWLSHPARTILGDTLSLAGCGVLLRRGRERPGHFTDGLRCGPDPYDHAPALHALRLGCFDYAVVNAVTADRFRDAGLLDEKIWGVSDLTVPLPGTVLFAARRLPAAVRLALGEHLAGLGRHPEQMDQLEADALRGLGEIGLVGFNLLLEPDFDLLRRRFDSCWPGAAF